MRIEAHCTTTPQALASAIIHGDARQQADILEALAFAWSAEIERGTGLRPAIGLASRSTDPRNPRTGAMATAARLRLIAAEIEDEATAPRSNAPVSPEILATLEAADRAFGEIATVVERRSEGDLVWPETSALVCAQRNRLRAAIATLKGTPR
jgi:hypothetical protein